MSSRRQLANAIRALSMDAVQRANSGHPGTPMGMADIAEVLWNDFFRHNPANPGWADRDRFVMSNGHGSMLLYSILHLTGYDLPMAELQNFRQLHSKTPGHPEYGYTPGIETTTGPLGQGLANAVGMALAERTLAAQFNRPGLDIVNHYTYASVGDGCLMEGISHEACSLAGTLGLGKLIVIYDSNRISIDGEVEGWFSEDIPKRFDAYRWHVLADIDGHDPEAVCEALGAAQAETDRPSLLCCHTTIGLGSPNKQGKAASHGAPLGADEVALVRETIDWPWPAFTIPEEIYQGWDARVRGTALEAAWSEKFSAYRKHYPEQAAEFRRRVSGDLPGDWQETSRAYIEATQQQAASIASRKASQNALNAYGPALPELVGGSADLTGSNLTLRQDSSVISASVAAGNYLYYGVREFGMAAINNGMALHGGFIPYGGTFLIFTEYARNALRMAALMKQRNIFVLTHDSIGLGEDGPTHQAVEQTATLRLIPNMSVWRPCDAVETAVAWKAALENRDQPTSLLLSRQSLPAMTRSAEQLAAIERGGYILVEPDGGPDLIIIATGSEVAIAVAAAQQLNGNGARVRVVSMPSTDVFDSQSQAYREQVLPAACRRRIAVEAGIPDYWRKYVGLDGRILGVPSFGESAPGAAVFEHFGINVEGLMQLVEA
ncbi:MAG: transketolase [Gammaproteobacteria bacterium]|nr:transketolase [Gammaproteobacteria bacterium]MCY4283679.1 transketolase [Gammaproteobacteria bacterium]MCY4337884.1 transketolase [Gammaproteobacteria bacterium]